MTKKSFLHSEKMTECIDSDALWKVWWYIAHHI